MVDGQLNYGCTSCVICWDDAGMKAYAVYKDLISSVRHSVLVAWQCARSALSGADVSTGMVFPGRRFAERPLGANLSTPRRPCLPSSFVRIHATCKFQNIHFCSLLRVSITGPFDQLASPARPASTTSRPPTFSIYREISSIFTPRRPCLPSAFVRIYPTCKFQDTVRIQILVQVILRPPSHSVKLGSTARGVSTKIHRTASFYVSMLRPLGASRRFSTVIPDSRDPNLSRCAAQQRKPQWGGAYIAVGA
ncbi:hypothetical protein B0H17DRAFT_393977 [Mycena rosella]|uniref:Uncharacterized protein n=1 Tax=Mycena rosella TaxID=1033263 RepID=A0AAD7CQ50_MYCRO|nr:hypothetical protein B0H17DRAFT_393977 [Mycena rosella]